MKIKILIIALVIIVITLFAAKSHAQYQLRDSVITRCVNDQTGAEHYFRSSPKRAAVVCLEYNR